MAPTITPANPTEAAKRKARQRWALPVVLGAAVITLALLVVGILGLTADPVKSRNADGTATLQGTFEPYACSTTSCNGYVQAGARSVFVQFPAGCREPMRGTTITVNGRPAPDLGKAAYRAVSCV